MEMQAFWQTETKYYVLLPPDHVAVIAMPGAMENWGLIIYGEFALLLTEEEFSSFNKENIATFVAHEVAHQVRDIIGTEVFCSFCQSYIAWSKVTNRLTQYTGAFVDPLGENSVARGGS